MYFPSIVIYFLFSFFQFSFKVLQSHPEVESQPASADSFQCLEASVLVSMLPIRLNIDQVPEVQYAHAFTM